MPVPNGERLRKATLCILVSDGRILLAMKKRGFGTGKWNGAGGKQEAGEDVKTTAVRETVEEIGVVPTSMRKVAVLNFYFPESPKDKDWNQQVHIFLVDGWEGTPKETEEMNPKWFELGKIPYESMWDDDRHWLPKVLEGKNLKGDFIFDKDQKLAGFKIKEVARL
jgi:8-oxo-dGTP pyrophosphatase MutT (NUDIX family)